MTKPKNTKLLSEITACFKRLKVKSYIEPAKSKSKGSKKLEATKVVENKPQAYPAMFEAAALVILSVSKRPTKFSGPRKFLIDKASTVKELNGLSSVLERHSNELLLALTKLNADAISVLDGGLGITGLSEELVNFAQSIRVRGKQHETSAKSIRGAPQNIKALLVAKTTASYYHRITGFKPTIIKYHYKEYSLGGPFYNLLDEIFTLLKIDVSREHYAREALRSLGFLGSKKKD